jgi:hypothetical protein
MWQVFANAFQAIAKGSGSRAYDLEEIVLDHSRLADIPEDSLSSFPGLQCLYLPFNHLKILHNLDRNPRLKLIDARSSSRSLL